MTTCQNEKITSQCVFFVTSIRCVDQQRNSRSCHLATDYAGVDKLPDYLWSDTGDVTFLDE